jgi:hypothetical protein
MAWKRTLYAVGALRWPQAETAICGQLGAREHADLELLHRFTSFLLGDRDRPSPWIFAKHGTASRAYDGATSMPSHQVSRIDADDVEAKAP